MNYIKFKNKCGFTLLELLAAIATILIIASVAILALGGTLSGAREGAVRRQAQVFSSGYQTFVAAGGSVPEDGTDVPSMKQNALLVANRLTNSITTAYGEVGPFVSSDAVADWTIPDTEFLGKKVDSVYHYIGFDPGRGFIYLGAD